MTNLPLKVKKTENIWEDMDFVELAKEIKSLINGDWSWARNHTCKYIEIRIDMRDGGFLLCNRIGERISLEQLKWQYSEETPKPPE